MSTTTIYLIRHGESVANVQQTYENTALTERGRQQAAEVAAELPTSEISALYSSHLERAVQTAEIIKPFLPRVAKFEIREDLQERIVGSLDSEMKMIQSRAKYRIALEQGDEAIWDLQVVSDSESFRQAHQRFISELEEIAEGHEGEAIAVISHGGLLRALLVKLNYATFKDLFRGRVENTAIVVLEYSQGEFVLKSTQKVFPAEAD